MTTISTDRTGWPRVALGDVVLSVNEVVRDPASEGIERVIGLEHLDPRELAISRWATTQEETTFTKRVRPGQTLFGKRRAYQRKTAYSEFDAICSGDILVLTSIDARRLLPELLPFILSSDAFYARALETSAGSLSPRTRWSDIAKYEFGLPPIEEQRKIADLLWAIERHVDALNAAERALAAAGAQKLRNLLGQGREQRLGDVLTLCQYGSSSRSTSEGSCPMLRMTNLTDGEVVLNDLAYVELPAAEVERFRVTRGDVLFNRTNSFELVGKSGIVLFDTPCVFASYLIRLRASSDVLPEYLNLFINSALGQERIRLHVSRGVSQANVSATNLKSVLIPVPSKREQAMIVGMDRQVRDARVAVMNAKEAARSVLDRLRGPTFGTGV